MYLLPNQDRSRWVVIVFYFHALALLTFSAAQWWQASLIGSEDLTNESAEQSDIIIGVVALIFLASLILNIVVFILWFRRAYANLHRLEGSNSILSYTEGWAAGCWFVPFMNLVRPYTIMKEIWNETQSNIPGKIEREGLQDTELIGWWWGAWIISNIVTNIASKLGGTVEIDDIIFGLEANAIGQLTALPGVFLAIRMVQKTNVFERELYDSQVMSDPSEHLLV
jgi:hypothetical protein